MILFEKRQSNSVLADIEWWAVDVDSLTMAHCKLRRGRKLSLRYVPWGKSRSVVDKFPEKCDQGEAAINLLIECRELHRHISPCPVSIREMDPSDQMLIPEYILLGKPDGPAEAIMHTVSPIFIARFPDGPVLKEPREHFLSYRLDTKLGPEGWEYWRSDAWQEFLIMVENLGSSEMEEMVEAIR